MQQPRLGELDIEAEAFSRAPGRSREELLHERAPPNLLRRHVDRYTDWREPQPAPQLAVFDCLLQYPVTDGDDHAGSLEHLQKPARQHQTVLRVIPAQQRFDALDTAGRDVHLGLVMNDELLLIQRDAQLVLERQPLGNVAVHLDLIMQVLLAGFLRLFERRLGPLHQGVAVLAVDRETGQSGLERGADRAALDMEHVAKHSAFQQRGNALCRSLDLRQHYHEGAAAHVTDSLVIVHVVFEAIGHALQQQISDMAPEAVIDVAEMNDVERDDRRRALRARALLQQRVKTLAHQRSLGETGQLVEIGKKLRVVLFLAILQTERQGGDHVLEQDQLLIAEQIALARGERQDPDPRAVDAQRQSND